jgi:hypothetical protein
VSPRVDWKARSLAAEARVVELEAELAALRNRPRTGRPPKAPASEDKRLILQVTARLGVTQADLAQRLGVDPSKLSRANDVPLPEGLRARLRAMLGAEQEAATTTDQTEERRP